MSDGRKQLRVWISDDAKQGLEEYARRFGTTVTAFLEAVGLWCGERAENGFDSPTVENEAVKIVERARDLDAERRRR